MKTKKVVGKIFDAINYSKKLKISSIYSYKEICIRSGAMTTDRQKEKAQTKYLSKFSDNQIH